MEKLASGRKLKHNVVILSRFGEVDEADNVGMVELSHDLNLFEDICSLQTGSQWMVGKNIVICHS